ncbi:Smr/MutS family protein [Luteitalea sp.]|jgi:DNA mismatch repair protein MutS2|uniref:Smr/MutS family protein n=1 Tax=Luteitalea sp. TaxID=2004800 RepID=UPI0037CC8E01
MAFVIGDQVLVVSLNRHGQIVEARGQAWRVLVGGLTITCRRDDLRAITQKSKKSRPQASSAPAKSSSQRQPHATSDEPRSTIDLHGCTTVEAREALLRHLDVALRAGHALVEVVHGIGTGRVRGAVMAAVKDVPSVRSVRPHPTNKGVLLVYL